MPYIPERRRAKFDLIGTPDDVGELTYALTLPIRAFLKRKPKPLRFQHFAEVLGALASVAGEFRRVVVEPYEDEKIAENGGDVF